MNVTTETTAFGIRYKTGRCSITRERHAISVLMLNEDVGLDPYATARLLIAALVPEPPASNDVLPFAVKTREHTTSVEFYLR